jgi:LmeA-like phospholipid-binding
VSEYQRQRQPGWPTQPSRYSGGAGGQDGSGQAGYDPADYGQPDYGQGGYRQPGSGQTGYGRRAPRRRRRRRGLIALVITLVVLAVAFVIGDQIARSYAQNTIAARLQSSSGLSAKPSVTIEGWPFLTQVAAHDIRTIKISARDVQTDKLDISSINATATGVHPDSSFNSATIDNISGTALITFASLENAAGAQGITVTADPAAGPNAATVSAGPLSATAQIVQTGPSKLTIKIDKLNGIAGALIGLLPDYTINVPPLPAGLQVRGVSVTDQGIVVALSAHDTTLSQ